MRNPRRETILFWCQVSLFVTAMVTLLGILILLAFFVVSQMHALDVDRARERAMLQGKERGTRGEARGSGSPPLFLPPTPYSLPLPRQHHTELAQHNEALADHGRAREAASAAFAQLLAEHQAQMRLLQGR